MPTKTSKSKGSGASRSKAKKPARSAARPSGKKTATKKAATRKAVTKTAAAAKAATKAPAIGAAKPGTTGKGKGVAAEPKGEARGSALVVRKAAVPTKPAKGGPAKKGATLTTTSAPQVKTSGRARKRRGSRRSEPRSYAPGELVLPTGTLNADEVHYLLRGCVAAQTAAGEAGMVEIATKRGDDAPLSAEELSENLDLLTERFDEGELEPLIPNRPPGPRQTFASVVDRARHRRREIGAFLRGLDLGGTETSHMDPHGEASLQNLMEWAARLEVLTEADQPPQADFSPFHRVLDQLELNTESLILDVEQTLRRLRQQAS